LIARRPEWFTEEGDALTFFTQTIVRSGKKCFLFAAALAMTVLGASATLGAVTVTGLVNRIAAIADTLHAPADQKDSIIKYLTALVERIPTDALPPDINVCA
jgi:hypothetical protein